VAPVETTATWRDNEEAEVGVMGDDDSPSPKDRGTWLSVGR
jgi:hypothetical protein